METESLIWILGGGLLMSAIALVGSTTALLSRRNLEFLLLPFVSLAAGSLLGGAFFHMLPEGLDALAPLSAAVWLVAGFTVFLGLEQFLHWHSSHRDPAQERKPVIWLILTGDAIHNFIGGIGIASTFLIDPRAGVIAWLAAAAHEVPQELGDFAILVHGGLSLRRALLWNLFSALAFPLGALLAWFGARQFDVSGLVLFGAGTFVYIAASDLVPEIKAHRDPADAIAHFACFILGLTLTLLPFSL